MHKLFNRLFREPSKSKVVVPNQSLKAQLKDSLIEELTEPRNITFFTLLKWGSLLFCILISTMAIYDMYFNQYKYIPNQKIPSYLYEWGESEIDFNRHNKYKVYGEDTENE